MNLFNILHNLRKKLVFEEELSVPRFEITEENFDNEIYNSIKSQVHYWDGLRSKKVLLESSISITPYLLLALVIIINVNNNEEINHNLKVFFSWLAYLLAGIGFYSNLRSSKPQRR